MREKLIELLKLAMDYSYVLREMKSTTTDANEDPFIAMADLLIANGVTIQRWIPVTERLPGICDTVLVCYDFMGGKAVRISDRYGKNGMLWSGLPNGQKPTHWMPLPEAPKGE